MERYLESCLAQNIRYTQTSQNITIAQVLYPDAEPKAARARFFHLCREIIDEFERRGVFLRFYHCANKTVRPMWARPRRICAGLGRMAA